MIVARCMCVPGPGEQHARGCPEWRPSATETSEPADPPECMWRGLDDAGEPIAIGRHGEDIGHVEHHTLWWDAEDREWCRTNSLSFSESIFAAALAASYARIAAAESEVRRLIEHAAGEVDAIARLRDKERERADAAEATIAAMRDGIERVMMEMRGGGT